MIYVKRVITDYRYSKCDDVLESANFTDELILAYAFAIIFAAKNNLPYYNIISQFTNHWYSNTNSIELFESTPITYLKDNCTNYVFSSDMGNGWDSHDITDLSISNNVSDILTPMGELLLLRFDEISEYVFQLLRDYIYSCTIVDFSKLNPMVLKSRGFIVTRSDSDTMFLSDAITSDIIGMKKLVSSYEPIEFSISFDKITEGTDMSGKLELLEAETNRYVANYLCCIH